MGENWERINEALGAEAQGRSLAPHVSRSTLFGIKSSVEEQMASIAADASTGKRARDDTDAPDGARARELRAELLAIAHTYESRLIVGRADRYYIHRARTAGYDIPAYPFAASGDLAAFLRDEGAADVPGWYAARGVTPAQYRNLAAYALLALCSEDGSCHERVIARVAPYVDESRFLPLADDPLLQKAPAPALESLLDAARELVEIDNASDSVH